MSKPGIVLNINKPQGQTSYSIRFAKKVGDKRVYEYVRNGKTMERESVEVSVNQISVKERDGQDARLRVIRTRDTYIRALARDMRRKIRNGATVTALTHNAIGEYTIDEALTLTTLDEQWVSIVA